MQYYKSLSQVYKTLRLVFLLITTGYGISYADDHKKAAELKTYFWNESSADFKVTEIPEKWNNKSAVIIARNIEKLYKKRRVGGLLHLNYEHERVKILSKKALEEYAQFEFPESGGFGPFYLNYYAGFKIIKPDGKVIEVPVSDAVVSEMKVNRFKMNMKKLAIPNLEIGDIVDYYLAEEQSIPPIDNYHSFDPFIFTLSDTYPIMKQKISFDVERKCYLNAKSLNGAPKLVKTKKGDNDLYVLEDEDRDSHEDLNWFYPYRELPTIKFKVVYAKGSITYFPIFIGQQGALKSTISQSEVVDFVAAYIKDFQSAGMYFHKIMKKRFKGRTDKTEMAKELFYFFRNTYFIQHVEGLIQKGLGQHDTHNQFKIVSVLSYVYQQFDIPHQILVGIPRSISTIDDIILEDEIICMIQVNGANDEADLFIGEFDNYAIVNDYMYLLEGTETYTFTNKSNIKTFDFPISTADENNISKEVTFTIDDLTTNKGTAKIRSKAIGHLKKTFQYQFLDFYDYKNEEMQKYNMEDYSLDMKKNAKAKYTQKKLAYLEEIEQQQLESLKALCESDYDVELKEVKDLHVLSHGRHHEQPAFEFIYKADMEGIVKKAGEDYLMNIGKLVDGQLQLEKDELERDFDVHMPYARSYNYKIVFDIPKGYEVQGVDNLNTNVSSEFGGFSSTAKIANYQLVLEARKHYDTNFVAKENWGTMLEFLKAAEDFNSKSVLLKKIEK